MIPDPEELNMRYRAAIPLLSVLIGLLLMNYNQPPGPVAVTAAASETGYRDISYYYKPVPQQPPQVQTPSGEKPQSKLWFNDGRWWASMFNNQPGNDNYHIYWLDIGSQTWIDTGTVLDTRAQTKADCLWDGTHLYVASGGGFDTTGAGTRLALPALLYRYSYNSTTRTYSLDFDPVTIRNDGAETIVIDKDTAGTLWITYTQGNKVYVNHSRTSDMDWDANVAPFQVAGANPNVSPDDISSLVAVDGRIVVFWSNETSGQFSGSSDTAFYFAIHTDGASDTSWVGGVAWRQPSIADDHINLKSLQADSSGNIFAMVKTSLNALGNPQLLLLVAKKQPNSSYLWSSYVESIREDKQTRPVLLIDTDHRQLYVFTSTESGGDVYYKQTSLDNIQFGTGPGTLFMSYPGYALNNVTSTKQTVNTASGIALLSSHDNAAQLDNSSVDYYFHNYLSLGAPPPTITPKPPTPTLTPTLTPAPTVTPTLPPGGPLKTRVYVTIVMR
jgi:hypothetical protein